MILSVGAPICASRASAVPGAAGPEVSEAMQRPAPAGFELEAPSRRDPMIID